MSRKNKNFRAWEHQNPNGTPKEAWDAAWKSQQGKAYSQLIEKHREFYRAVLEMRTRQAIVEANKLIGASAVRMVDSTDLCMKAEAAVDAMLEGWDE